MSTDSTPLLISAAVEIKKKKKYATATNFAISAIVMGLLIVLVTISINDKAKQCNLFDGRWVRNPSGPAYDNTSCKFIDEADDCIKNGRPDTEYLHWRWKPRQCDLPPFNPDKFMNSMRDKSWALIGDSILRNQLMSMICLLSKIEEPIEIYHDEAYKSRTFHFATHNFTLATIWAPFLMKSITDEDDEGRSKNIIHLYLDILDPNLITNYNKYDHILISGGQWFLKSTIIYENNQVIGCHNCNNKNIKELGIYDPYRKALVRVFNFIAVSEHKPRVIFRTWAPDHFEHGEWSSGGVCNRTEPYSNGEFNGKESDRVMHGIEVEEVERGRRDGMRMEILDVFRMSLMRPDGHPGRYRRGGDVQSDCLHWCLPGVVDAWNDLVMKILF